MMASGMRRSIVEIVTFGFLLAPGLSAAQPNEAASAARDAAAAASEAAATAARTIDIPHYPHPGNEPHYQVDFQIKSDKAKSLIVEHKKMCESLGPSRCKVVVFSPDRGEYGRQGITLQLRLPPGSAPAMIASLGKLNNHAGFKTREHSPIRLSEQNRAELTIRKALLLAQHEKLTALQASAPAGQQDAIRRQFDQIRAQLAHMDRELASRPVEPSADILTIQYQDHSQLHPSRASRKFDEMFTVLGLALLAVTGIALLTILYFAIIGLGFLWVRRFARRRGLLGNSAGSNQKSAS